MGKTPVNILTGDLQKKEMVIGIDTGTTNNQKKIVIICAVTIILFGCWCYDPFALYFQNDDFIHITLSAQGILLQHNSFRPICDVSIMFDYWLWGKNAWGYHLNNLILHIITCCVLFYLSRLVLKKFFFIRKPLFICLLTSSIFFIYAMHSEAVFWILGRSAILATIFALLFLICYIQKNESQKYFAGYIFFLVAGLLTYESCWVLPSYTLIISIAQIKNNQSSIKKETKHLLIIFSIFILYLIVRWHYIDQVIGSYETKGILSNNYLVLLKNYLLLVIRSFIPTFIYNKILLFVFAGMTLMISFMYYQLQKSDKRKLIVFFTCFLVSLLPYISLGIDTNGTEGERFLYMPSVLICLLIAVIIHKSTLADFKKCLFAITTMALYAACLFTTMINFRFASTLVSTVLSEMEKYNNQTLYFIDLPQAQKGAYIFRTGLEEASQWLQDKNNNKIIICSQRSELRPLANPFFVRYEDGKKSGCDDSDLKTSIHAQTSILRFTDTALLITK